MNMGNESEIVEFKKSTSLLKEVENSNKEYICICFSGDCRPYSYKGKFYLRSATSDHKISSERKIRYLIKPIEKNTFEYPYKHKLAVNNNMPLKTEVEKLLRNLWYEIFSTPLLPFERCFTIDDKVSLNIGYLNLLNGMKLDQKS